MKKISMIFIAALFALFTSACCTANENNLVTEQNLQVFSVANTDGSITAKTIQKAFGENGVTVDVNNDMNSIFSKRYGSVHHTQYNLAIFTNSELVNKLMKEHPSIGLITPLSMSIYSGKDKSINVSTLSLTGMSRITKIPATNPDLIAYAKLVDSALQAALKGGKYLDVQHNPKAEFSVSSFPIEMEIEDGDTYTDAKESFKEEFESEISPVGFLVPKSYTYDHADYDFFDTYSIIRFNAIYPVSKNSPDAGAYAPFSVVIYKKKSEDTAHIMYPSISNWINDLDISEKETVAAVNQTQTMMSDILSELTE